ncbi:MAG: Fic family protein [Pleurocapsa sp.]
MTLNSGNTRAEQLDLELFPQVTEKSLQDRIKKLRERRNPKEVEALIIELCRLKPRSSSELESLLSRNRKYLLDRYLKPLIDKGLLEYTNPQNPKDPTQAYRSTQSDFDSK